MRKPIETFDQAGTIVARSEVDVPDPTPEDAQLTTLLAKAQRVFAGENPGFTPLEIQKLVAALVIKAARP